MKKITLTFLLANIFNILLAQKPAINYSICQNFPQIGERRISNDGNYVFYTVNDIKSLSTRLHLKSVDGTYRKEYLINNRVLNIEFTEDSRWLLFTKPGDSLCLFHLKDKKEQYITNCKSFMTPANGEGKWMAYQLSNQDLILQNLWNGEKVRYPNVEDYLFSSEGKVLLLGCRSMTDKESIKRLMWITVSTGRVDTIWNGSRSNSYTFDQTESKLAFVSEDSTKTGEEKNIWYYEKSMVKAESLVNKNTEGMKPDIKVVNSGLKFSPKGDKLFFNVYLSPIISSSIATEVASVDIWSYKDQYLQEEQLQKGKHKRTPILLSVINLEERKLSILKKNDDAFFSFLNEGGNDDFLLVSGARTWEGYSSDPSRMDVCLVGTKGGSRECKDVNVLGTTATFSPTGKFLFWYDMEQNAYFTQNLQNGTSKNITKDIKLPLYDELWDKARLPFPYTSKPIWVEGDEAVLIYDRYDIWKVDPTGSMPPVNITSGYGRRSKIIFRCIYAKPFGVNELPIKSNATMILSAFNEVNKDNGFFKINLGQNDIPQQLVMSPNIYYFSENFSTVSFSTFLRKAKNADVYLLTRESATEYPNLLVTKDFKTFVQVSELTPQKDYNWLTSELVRWTTFEGRPATGILYKPENFDPQKKYPIIFCFYERLSDGLNKFIEPTLSGGPINIPYFVSQGYLIFCPDIHYTIGEPGESAYSFVVSAAKVLREKQFVDRNKMGIQGHSFGGYEVNYLVTRTGIFAAACSAAGPSDLIGGCGSLIFSSSDAHAFYEKEQLRLGTSLWQSPELYIKNSPLLAANKITTPLLIMHNRRDANVPWSHGVEFFTALRRLGKPVWMLQYDDDGHTLSSDENQLDYSTRLMQFFDHYLKYSPVAKWMSRGIPAIEKQRVKKMELDMVGKCSDQCQVCKQWNVGK